MARNKSNTRRKRAEPVVSELQERQRKRRLQYADRALIALCITIKAELAAFYGCGGADPDGDSVHAGPIWNRHMDRAEKAIEQAAAIKATTWAGLAAKAAAMVSVLDDEGHGMSMGEHSEAYYRSFADDAHRLAMEQIDKERIARLEAEKAARAGARS